MRNLSGLGVVEAPRRGWWLAGGMCLVLVGLLAGLAGMIRQNSRDAHQALSDRFEARAALTASFAHNFVTDLASREKIQAERLLGGTQVDQGSFESVVAAFDFEAAVLLDGDGRLLQVWPSKPELIGKDMTLDYAHLRAAVAGEIGVSEVVPSAAKGMPITAVAVRFASASGHRVFSGAFSPGGTPLGAYLDSVVPVTGGAAYLLDRSGDPLGSSREAEPAGSQIIDAPLGVTQLRLGSGTVTAAVSAVPDAPWRVVLLAPSDALFAPVDNAQLSPWALWFVVALSGGLAVVLLVGLARARADAAATARADLLTGLPNRRAIHEALGRSAALAERHQIPMAVVMIDVDNFKEINDALGHDQGDVVLQGIAAALVAGTRTGDIAGRWGGEEFLVVLPHTTIDTATVVAERIRCAIASTVDTRGRPVTASLGIAALRNHDTVALVSEADTALYAAKAAGRDRVHVFAPLATSSDLALT